LCAKMWKNGYGEFDHSGTLNKIFFDQKSKISNGTSWKPSVLSNNNEVGENCCRVLIESSVER